MVPYGGAGQICEDLLNDQTGETDDNSHDNGCCGCSDNINNSEQVVLVVGLLGLSISLLLLVVNIASWCLRIKDPVTLTVNVSDESDLLPLKCGGKNFSASLSRA